MPVPVPGSTNGGRGRLEVRAGQLGELVDRRRVAAGDEVEDAGLRAVEQVHQRVGDVVDRHDVHAAVGARGTTSNSPRENARIGQ